MESHCPCSKIYIEYCGTIFAVGLRPSLTHHALSTIGQTNISCIFRGLWLGLLMPHADLRFVKKLHDRRFHSKKFTQKTRNFQHLLNRDKKCVNALNSRCFPKILHS